MKQTVRMVLPGVLVGVACACGSGEPPATNAAAPDALDGKGVWTELKIGWGHRGALALDRLTGNVFGPCWHERGVLMSSDLGKTFTRVDGKNVAGDPFSAYSIFAAADGGKIAVFSSQGNQLSGHSLDGGKTWTSWTPAGLHGFDYGVVDWESGAIFVMPHEEYRPYFSMDMGKNWRKLESIDYPGGSNNPHQVGKFKYYQSGIGVFGASELVYSRDSGTGIQRSEDGGKTWAKVADYFCEGPLQMFKGVGYWLAKKEEGGKWSGLLLATRDNGKTWQPVGAPIENGDSTYMSVLRFGMSEKHILVAAAEGILESTTGGATWSLALKYPEGIKPTAPCVDTPDCFEYDPIHDVFYVFFFSEARRTWVYRR